MDLDHAMTLEIRVWEALQTGNQELDGAMLSEDFLGVYPSGFSDRAGHVDQLAAGPTVHDFHLSDARLLELSDDHVLLCYRADWRSLESSDSEGPGAAQAMYISSIWARRDRAWINTFSQDTPTDPRPGWFD